MNSEQLQQVVHLVTTMFELGGILVIVIGTLVSAGLYVGESFRGGRSDAYRALRSNLGRSILLGLELLVAADIINTVAIDPTLQSLAILAGIVLIRTFLSFALEVEIEGRWPWQASREPAG